MQTGRKELRLSNNDNYSDIENWNIYASQWGEWGIFIPHNRESNTKLIATAHTSDCQTVLYVCLLL